MKGFGDYVGIFGNIDDGIVKFFSKFVEWILDFILDVIRFFMDIIFRVVEFILEIVVKIFNEEILLNLLTVFEFPIIDQYMDTFIKFGLSLLYIFTLYQLIKNLFSPIGFSGEDALKSLITFIFIYIFIHLTPQIVFAGLGFLDDFIKSYDMNAEINFNFSPLDYSAYGSFGAAIGAIAQDCIRIALIFGLALSIIISGARVLMRSTLLVFTMFLGPIVSSAGIITSQKNLPSGWVKTVFTQIFIIVVQVLLIKFLITYIKDMTTIEFYELAVVIGIALSLDEAEKIVGSLASGMGSVQRTEGFGRMTRALIGKIVRGVTPKAKGQSS